MERDCSSIEKHGDAGFPTGEETSCSLIDAVPIGLRPVHFALPGMDTLGQDQLRMPAEE